MEARSTNTFSSVMPGAEWVDECRAPCDDRSLKFGTVLLTDAIHNPPKAIYIFVDEHVIDRTDIPPLRRHLCRNI